MIEAKNVSVIIENKTIVDRVSMKLERNKFSMDADIKSNRC